MTAPPDMRELEGEIGNIKKEKEAAVDRQDFEKAAEFRDLERKAKDKLVTVKKDWSQKKSETETKVTEEDVALIVSKWTGIPLIRLEEKETEKFLKMEDGIRKRVVGQGEAISAIAHAVRRSRA